jgi:hypothetical protein
MADFFTIPVPFATPAYDDTIGLRDEILRRPLGLEFHPKDLATEFDSIHLACYHSSWELVGCLVLVPKSNSIIKMRQVAVREDQQGRASENYWSKSRKYWHVNWGIRKWC